MKGLIGSLRGFYKRRKSPWIGFVLVLLFGPFGFLYHSWKTALATLFVVLPLWMAYLRHTRFDLIDNPRAHYVALLALAAFAFLQIKGQLATRNSLASAEVIPNARDISDLRSVALSFMPSEVEKGAFQKYLGENPMIAEKLRGISGRNGDPISQCEIANALNSYALVQANAGDLPEASGTLILSLVVLEENVTAWATMAEVHLAMEDLIAARWANKVCNFNKPQPNASEFLKDLYSETPVLQALGGMKERMQQIIHICSEHPEWGDTYPSLKQLPRYRSL